MRKADLGVAVGLILIGLLVLGDAIRLGFGWDQSGPRPGFFPFYLAVILIVCSVVSFLKAFLKFRKEGEKKPLMPPGAFKSILWVLAPAIGMVAISELVGLHIAAALYLLFYMRAVGKIGWATTVAVSVIVPAILYVSFDKLFLVPLPQGLWGAKLLPF